MFSGSAGCRGDTRLRLVLPPPLDTVAGACTFDSQESHGRATRALDVPGIWLLPDGGVTL